MTESTNSAEHDELAARFKSLLAVGGNGAVETDLFDGLPLMVAVIGPIKTWWGRIDSEEYRIYNEWRELVRAELIHSGSLVYLPHRAWSGPWHMAAQKINDMAVAEADLVVAVTPPGVEAVGTEAEIAVAELNGVPVIFAPPGGLEEIEALLKAVKAVEPKERPEYS